mgnify:CR=1 FL=1
MKAIPKKAQKTAEFVRWWSKKPSSLPRAWHDGYAVLRWGDYCPIGLAGKSVGLSAGILTGAPPPSVACREIGIPQGDAAHFVDWWDGLLETDAKEAVEALWG